MALTQVPAAQTGGMTLLSTTTLTGASVTIGSIPATYRNLQLVIANFKPATNSAELRLRYNSDSNTNYRIFQLAPSQAQYNFNGTSVAISEAAHSTVSNNLAVLNIYDYANTTTYKIANSMNINNDYITSTNFSYTSYALLYGQTTAISNIVLFPNSGNFTSGTAYLYGVK